MTGKKSWISHTNRNRLAGSDFDRIVRIQKSIDAKYYPLQHKTLRTPHGRFPARKPDLLMKIHGFKIPIELDGGIHGFNDEVSESTQTKTRNDDYIREGYTPIILNHEQLKEEKISEELYIKCAIILLEPIFRAKQRIQGNRT